MVSLEEASEATGPPAPSAAVGRLTTGCWPVARITTSGLYGGPAHGHDWRLARPKTGSQRWRFRTTLERGSARSLILRWGCRCRAWPTANQITTGVESPLYARAFVIADPESASAAGRVAIIVADIWSGTRRVKDAVLKRLAAAHGGLYADENLLLAGTHTHSAPGGYSGTLLYDFDFSRGGCDEATVTCIADGCVRAVEMAHANLAPGRIYVNRGEVTDCGRNRSEPAYLCNPQAERDQWGADTDTGDAPAEVRQARRRRPGAAGWGAELVSDPSDRSRSEEHARHRRQQGVREFAVRAADGHRRQPAGDVRGRVRERQLWRCLWERRARSHPGWDPRSRPDGKARPPAVRGRRRPLPDRHRGSDRRRSSIDTPASTSRNVTIGAGGARTWPAALGISFAAGSSEDSVPEPDLGIDEGITAQNISEGDALITGVAGLGLSAIFGISVIDQAEAVTEREGHLPKPVVLMPGIDDPPAVPQVLPVQLLRIGTVAVLGIPGELTTMAGRRLRTHRPRRTVSHRCQARRARHVCQRVRAIHHHPRGVLLAAVRGRIDAVRTPHARGLPADGG